VFRHLSTRRRGAPAVRQHHRLGPRQFQRQYADPSITKWAIFHYVYGVLHHPEYRSRYEANLKRELPRIPFVRDFWAFAKAGEALADLHIEYEKQPEYPLELRESPDLPLDWRVERMRLTKDRTAIVYNDFLTLQGVPAGAFEYRLGNRSALEWSLTSTRSALTSGRASSTIRIAWTTPVHRPPRRPGHHGQPSNDGHRWGAAAARHPSNYRRGRGRDLLANEAQPRSEEVRPRIT